MAQPDFPIMITFHRDGDAWVLATPEELVTSVEWFDSDDPTQAATVTDARGRAVRLKVQNQLLVTFEVSEDFGTPE
jgi:hypothetical protein